MASNQLPGSSAPSSSINSPTLHPVNAPFLSGAISELNARSSPAPPSNASVQADGTRSKRNKRDSRKKREAKGLDVDSAPPPKKRAGPTHNASVPSSDISILRPLLLAEPRSSDLLPPQPRQMNPVCRKTSDVLGQSWEFYDVVDKLTNKNGFRYSYAIADPGFPNIKYRQTDVPPYHARFSFEDSPAAILFSKDARAVTTGDPWQTARANVCAREGTYYYEARVISGVVNSTGSTSTSNGSGSSPRGHVRLGFARREADLEVNVGVDCYGYGIRDVNGEVVNRMRCEYFFPKGESIGEGDVVGMLITLPPLSLHKKIVDGTYDPAVDGHPPPTSASASASGSEPPSATNIIRDRIPFHYKNDFCWQQSNVFPTKQLRDYAFNSKETPTFGAPSPLNGEDASLRTLPGSNITIYKNGVKMGTPFKELYAFLPPASRLANGTNNLGIGERENADDGMIGYYPAVSCYGGGAVECRFEPPWWIGPPQTADNGDPVRAVGDRFTDQIVEDVLADIVDEVEAMFMWGGVAGDVVGDRSTGGGSGGGGDGDGVGLDGTADTKPEAGVDNVVGRRGQVAVTGGVVGGAEVLKGGVGAAYDAVVKAERSNNTDNHDSATPASEEALRPVKQDADDVNGHDAMHVDGTGSPPPTEEAGTQEDTGPEGQPSVGSVVQGSAADEDVEMT